MADTTFTDNSTVITAAWLNDINDKVYHLDLGDSDRSLVSKLQEIVSVKDYGAVGDGVADDSAAIQAAWDAIKAANGVLYFPAGTYRCLSALDFRVNYTSTQHRHAIVGSGAILDFSDTVLTSGDLVKFGANSSAQVNELASFVLSGFHVIGPHSASITDTSTAETSLVGISLEYALGFKAKDVLVSLCYKGWDATFTFPVHATGIMSDNCYIGLHLIDDMTLGQWDACQFKEGRFGILVQPSVNTKTVYGQTFNRTNLEGNKVGCVIDPLDGSGTGAHDLVFNDTYTESIVYDAFRIGRVWTSGNAATTGADRTRNVFNIKVIGGMWVHSTAWGSAGHMPVLFHAADTSDAPAGCVVDLPIPNLTSSSLGYSRKSTLISRVDISTGGTSTVREESTVEKPFIRFPATQVASSGANDLDDYEEGTITTYGVSFGGGTTGITYAASGRDGFYTKIGRVVYFTGTVELSNKGSSTGSARLTGLPFTKNATHLGSVQINEYTNLSSVTTVPWGSIENSTTTALLRVGGSGTFTALTDANFANNSKIVFSGFYFV